MVFTIVHTLDDEKVWKPRDTRHNLSIYAMLTANRIEWSHKSLAYVSNSQEGNHFGPDQLLVDLTRPEVFIDRSYKNEHGVMNTARYDVPRPTNCQLHINVCKLFDKVYKQLDGLHATFADSFMRDRDYHTSTSYPSKGSDFANDYVTKVDFFGKNGGRRQFDYNRGWVRKIHWKEKKKRWSADEPLAAGQVLFDFLPGGAAYLNISSWTGDLTYQFHQLATDNPILRDKICAVIHGQVSCYMLVFFRPQKSPKAPDAVEAITNCWQIK